MADKRKRDSNREGAGDSDRSSKKQKHGFRVGPQNLPDGTYRRKTQKIKRSLIERAQIKKDYAKLQRRQQQQQQEAEAADEPEPGEQTFPEQGDHSTTEQNAGARNDTSTAPHPDRQTLIDEEEAEDEPDRPSHTQGDDDDDDSKARLFQRRQRRPKPLPFKREHDAAQKRKAEMEERRRAREQAERQRQMKIEERERFRRAMAKARTGGPNGQRKLGRESKVLLEKVKKMVGDGI